MTTVPARGKLMWFALAVTMLTGFVDATGFLAFGRLFLASPDAGSIVAGVALVDDLRFGLFAGSLILAFRSEEHTSELQSLMRISYAVFCLKKKKKIILNLL